MDAIKQIIYLLIGEMKLSNEKRLLYVPKILYLLILLPSIIFVVLLAARSGSFFGKEEKVGIVKRILLHISMIFWAVVLWTCIPMIFSEL